MVRFLKENKSVLLSLGLTLVFLLGVIGAVYLLMSVLTEHLKMHDAYWLVPVFGAMGGVIGGILRNDNRLVLCALESNGTETSIRLGIVADIFFGLGGAAAASYLFSGTLKFTPNDPNSYVLLISLTLITGVFGRRFLELAALKLEEVVGARVLDETRKEVARADTRSKARSQFLVAKIMADAERYEEALDATQTGLASDPKNYPLLIQKGWILKRMGRLNEAIETLDEALAVKPGAPLALYNRACYRARLGLGQEQVLEDLKRAVEGDADLKKSAAEDKDLERFHTAKEFIALVR